MRFILFSIVHCINRCLVVFEINNYLLKTKLSIYLEPSLFCAAVYWFAGNSGSAQTGWSQVRCLQ